MSKYIMAHDLGTTGDKAVLYNEDGELIGFTSEKYETIYSHNNWAEQNPKSWWKVVCNTTNHLIKETNIDKKDIAVISFSGQMNGCLPVNKKGVPLRNAIIWADQRAVKEADELIEKIGLKRGYNITGHRISSNYTAPKIMWVKKHEPQVYKNTHSFLQAKDYIVCCLTNNFYTDFSDASFTNLFDINKKDWSQKLIEYAGIDRNLLPKLVTSSTVVGEVTNLAATQTGLKAGTPVVIGGGDGACAAVGAGATEAGVGYNYLGSSSWVAIVTNKPHFDSKMRTFIGMHLDPDIYQFAGTMQSAGVSYDWIRKVLATEEKVSEKNLKKSIYDYINFKVKNVSPGSNGLIFLPYLQGERSPFWNPLARGTFIGLTPNHKKAHFYRAVIEGISFNLKLILDILQEQTKLNEIRLIGGVSKSNVFKQILTDILGIPLKELTYNEESTSLGAAIAGGVGIGLFKDFSIAKQINLAKKTFNPNKQNVELYNKLLLIFKKSYENLIPIYDELNELVVSKNI